MALFGRAEARDFVDVFFLARRFGIRAMLDWAREKDAGFDPYRLALGLGRNLAQLEGVFPEGNCLVGVVLLGNSGAGITLVCPLLPNHAPQVATLMREHLPAKERANDQTQQS